MILRLSEGAIASLSEGYGLRVDPDAYVWQLSVGEQQRVEVLKALYRGAQLLILDEPTAVLAPQEVDDLFVTLEQMKNDGHAIIFISHKLNEVLAVSDRVTVLRDGHVVDTVRTSQTDADHLAQLMVGRKLVRHKREMRRPSGHPRLEIKDLWSQGDRGFPTVCGVNLSVDEGEIVGIAGGSGNGQAELAETVAGLREPLRGQIVFNNEDATGWSQDA